MEFQSLLPAGTPSHKWVISLDRPLLALEVAYMSSPRGQKKRKGPLFNSAVEPPKMTSSLHSSRTHFCVFHFELSFFLITSVGKPFLLKFKLTQFWIFLFSFLPRSDQRLKGLNTIMVLIRHKWESIFLLCHHPLKCIILLDVSLRIIWITSDFHWFHEPMVMSVLFDFI